jgi:hypothetical protein
VLGSYTERVEKGLLETAPIRWTVLSIFAAGSGSRSHRASSDQLSLGWDFIDSLTAPPRLTQAFVHKFDHLAVLSSNRYVKQCGWSTSVL